MIFGKDRRLGEYLAYLHSGRLPDRYLISAQPEPEPQQAEPTPTPAPRKVFLDDDEEDEDIDWGEGERDIRLRERLTLKTWSFSDRKWPVQRCPEQEVRWWWD